MLFFQIVFFFVRQNFLNNYVFENYNNTRRFNFRYLITGIS